MENGYIFSWSKHVQVEWNQKLGWIQCKMEEIDQRSRVYTSDVGGNQSLRWCCLNGRLFQKSMQGSRYGVLQQQAQACDPFQQLLKRESLQE